MATTDIERLVVQLSADVRTYQKSLDRARGATNKTASSIEARFNKMSGNIGSSLSRGFKGFAAGALGALALNKIVDGISEVITRLGDLSEQAEKVGTSAASLEGLSRIAEQDGASIEEVIKALTKLNLEVGKAKATGKGKLFELFTANDKKFSDDVIENFKTLADLAKNAPDEQTKALIASLGLGAKGFSNLLVTINRGGKEIGELMAKAVPDPEAFNAAAAKADEFGDKWKAAWRDFRNEVALSAVAVVELLDKLGAVGALDSLTKGVRNFREGLEALQHPTLLLKTALEDLTGLNFGASEQFQRDILKRTEGEIKVRTLKEQQLNIEKQIAEIHNMGGGSSPRLLQLQAELKVLDQQLVVAERIAQNQRIGSVGPTTGPAGPVGNIKFINPAPTTIVPGGADEVGAFADEIKKATQLIIKFEGTLDPRKVNPVPGSTATGIGQITDKTFRDLIVKYFGGNPKATVAEIVDQFHAMRFSAEKQVELVGLLAKDNANFLKNAGVEVSAATIQLAHFLGGPGAAAVLKAPAGTPVAQVLTPKQISDNRALLGGNRTVDDVIAAANARAGLTAEIEKYNDALQSVLDKTDAEIDDLKVKQAELGATTEAQKVYAKQLEITNQLRQQGVDVEDPAIKAAILERAEAHGYEAQKLYEVEQAQDAAKKSAEDLADAQQKAAETMQQIGQAFGGALQGFVSDLISGKKLTDALRDSLIKLGESLFNIALNNLTSSLGTGAGGGFLGSLFGGGGGGGLLSGLFHDGGQVGRSGGLRLARPGTFAGARRYHSGRIPGLLPSEMAGIFKKDELVFPNADALQNVVRRLGGRGSSGGVTQYNTFIAPDWKTSVRSQNQLARNAGSELERIQRTL